MVDKLILSRWNKIFGKPVSSNMQNKFNSNKLLTLTLAALPIVSTAMPVMADNAPKGKRSVKGGSWVDLQVATDKLSYTEGEIIKVTLKATNIQEKDAYLKFTSGQRFDFNLFKDGSKEAIYTWSANKMFAMMNSTIKLKMAQRETYNTEIGSEMGQLKPGKYRLVAHLTNSTKIGGLPIDFTIVPKTAGTTKAATTFTAKTDKLVYKVGEPVKVDFSLKNNLNKPQTFNFRSGQNYDVFIYNVAGEPIWNWSANIRFLMVSRPVTFAAGEKRDFSETWNGTPLPDFKVTPGKYTVQAVYASDPEIKAAPITIEIR